jgi:hypothetical protein
MIKRCTNGLLGITAAFLLIATPLFSPFFTGRVSAAPGPFNFPIITGNISCNVVLEATSLDDWVSNHDNYRILEMFRPTSITDARSPELDEEAGTTGSSINRINIDLEAGENMIAAYFVGVSPVNDYDCLDQGIMFQDENDPNFFYGVYKKNPYTENEEWGLRTGQYSVASKSFRFNGGPGGRTGAWYEIKNPGDPVASHVTFTSTSPDTGGGGTTNPPASGGGTVSTGPCASLPPGPVYDSCYNLNVQNFTTVTFRGETYSLKEWGGDNFKYLLTNSYDTARNTANTKTDCQPYFEFSTVGGMLDINIDPDGDDIGGFVSKMNELPNTITAGEYTDYDLRCNKVEDPYFASTDGNPVYHNLTNLRRMLVYSPSENKVAFIGGLNPNKTESTVANLEFTVSATNPNVFESKKIYESCGGDDGKAIVEISGDLKTIGTTWRSSTVRIPQKNCSSYHATFNAFTRSLAPEQNIADNSTSGQTAAQAAQENAEPAEPESVCGEGGALGWILCPILALLDETTQEMEEQIQGFLFVDTDRFDRNTEGGKQMYAAWSTFRGLATVIIVIIALIMIFSQAMGEGIFDNYSLKKILPRLIIAGIGIQLSWFMLVELVNVFNIIGNGVGGIVLSNFDLSPDTNLRDLIGGITGQASAGDFATGALFVGLAIAAPFFLGGIFTIAVGVAAAVLVGLVTLIVRDMIILLGVITAPIAIAMSYLPGTQKTSKWWWESFEKALMMYPIIMLLLAVGKVIGDLLFKSATPTGTDGIKMTYLIAGIIAWYLPFFFLPKALAAGGAALGKITGFAGDKSKGLFGSLQKGGQNLKEKRRGWAANKYVPGGGKMRNTAAILGSGSFSKRAALQKGGQYYSADLKKAQEELVAINRISNPKDRAKALGDMAVRSNPRVAQAAMEQLMKTGEIETLRQVMTAPNRNKLAVDTFRNTSFGDLKGKALDLAKDKTGHELQTELAKLSTADILGQDRSTIRDAIAGGIQPVLASRAVASMKDEKQWDNLGIEHKARLLHLAGAAVDIEGTNMDHGTLDDLRKKTLPATPPAGPPLPPPTPTPPPGPPLPPPTPTPPPGPPLPPPTPSDIRLKRDINFIETRHGLKLYSFQYLWSDEAIRRCYGARPSRYAPRST